MYGMIECKWSDRFYQILCTDTITGKYKICTPSKIVKYQIQNTTFISYENKFIELIYKSPLLNLYWYQKISGIGGRIYSDPSGTNPVVYYKGMFENKYYFLDKKFDKRIQSLTNKKMLVDSLAVGNARLQSKLNSHKWKELKNSNLIKLYFTEYNK